MSGRWEELLKLTLRYYPEAPLVTAERYAKSAAKFEEIRAAVARTGKRPPSQYHKLASIVASLGKQVGIPVPTADEWRGDDGDWGVIRGVTHATGFLPVDRAAILVDRDWHASLTT